MYRKYDLGHIITSFKGTGSSTRNWIGLSCHVTRVCQGSSCVEKAHQHIHEYGNARRHHVAGSTPGTQAFSQVNQSDPLM